MSCVNPVALFVYKRPDLARRVFDAIKVARPPVFVLVSDGPKADEEIDAVLECRELVQEVDWTCRVITIFSDVNIGCKARFFTALDEIFEQVDSLIILEDDCVPSSVFFDFCDWGLSKYKTDNSIALVSGSNFGGDLPGGFLNGYSRYMNCWGWATWADRWAKVDRYIGHKDLFDIRASMRKSGFNKWEARFWSEVFKNAIGSSSIWDFYIQMTMFKFEMLSVYPAINLIENIGFDDRATHTSLEVPFFVRRTKPQHTLELFERIFNSDIKSCMTRDRRVAKEIWSCNCMTSWRLKLSNIVRFAAS